MKGTEFTQQIVGLRGALREFTRRFTHDRDESLDLVQDTILKALTYRDKFRDDVNLKGWLFTIMRNTFINNYRQMKRRNIVSGPNNELLLLRVEDTYTLNRPASKFEYEDIWKNVHEIREELLTPFKMHTSGYKYVEIAKHLDIPVGTVKNRIFHARKEIQKKLQGY